MDPYYRANIHSEKKEEKKPYEPRPAKYIENYEDKGIKVFKPDFEPVIGTLTAPYEVKEEKADKGKKKDKKEKKKGDSKKKKSDSKEKTKDGSKSSSKKKKEGKKAKKEEKKKSKSASTF